MKNRNDKFVLFFKIKFVLTFLFVFSFFYLTAQDYNLTSVGYFPVTNNYTDITVSTIGNIYLLSNTQSILDLFSPDGKLRSSFGKYGRDKQSLNSPKSVWVKNDLNVYVADYDNDRIVMLSQELGFISTIQGQQYNSNMLEFRKPIFFAIMNNNDMILLDSEEKRFIRYNQQRQTTEYFGGIESGNLQLVMPYKVFYGNNQLVIYDQSDSTYKFFSSFGIPENSLLSSFYPIRYWRDSWTKISDNQLSDLFSNQVLLDFNAWVDEPIIDYEVSGRRIYLLTTSKVVILNATQ